MNGSDARALLDRLVDRVAPGSSVAGVPRDASLLEALDLDSMDFLFLMEELEAETGLAVPEVDYPSLRTPAGFEAYLVDRLPGPDPSGTT